MKTSTLGGLATAALVLLAALAPLGLSAGAADRAQAAGCNGVIGIVVCLIGCLPINSGCDPAKERLLELGSG